jgi:hypothetical protein
MHSHPNPCSLGFPKPPPRAPCKHAPPYAGEPRLVKSNRRPLADPTVFQLLDAVDQQVGDVLGPSTGRERHLFHGFPGELERDGLAGNLFKLCGHVAVVPIEEDEDEGMLGVLPDVAMA